MDIREQLRKYQLKPNFTYGQNFLVDDFILQDIADAAELTSADAVLEIGPGLGNLTELLCQKAGLVLSVEKDPKFFPVLKALKKDHKNNFRFEIADALEYNFQDFFSGQGYKAYKVVANIPYFITGKIIQMLLNAKFKPTQIVLLTQKEVAQNIVAKPGNLSLLAISVQLYGQPEIVQIVPAKSFYPAPKVDSAIVRINLFPEPKYNLPDEKKFFKLLKACFAGKRKQLHNSLTANLGVEKNQTLKILSDLKISPTIRPQEITIEQWVSLLEKISETNS